MPWQRSFLATRALLGAPAEATELSLNEAGASFAAELAAHRSRAQRASALALEATATLLDVSHMAMRVEGAFR